jgi:hypothetical protein
VQQYRALAIAVFDCFGEQPDFTHAWFPQAAFDETRIDGDIALARSAGGGAILKASAAFALVSRGPTAGNELRVPGRKSVWIVRLSGGAADLGSTAEKYSGLVARFETDGLIVINDPEYGEVNFRADGRVEAEGRIIDPAEWTVEGSSVLLEA